MLANRRELVNFLESEDEMREEDDRAITPRKIYLKSIGLSLDPFATPFAEQELELSSFTLITQESNFDSDGEIERPSFFSYYTPTATLSEVPAVLDLLRRPGTAFVFGARGAGKTVLRLMLEAEIRRVQNSTLVVSYRLSNDRQLLTPEQHYDHLTRALATDLFIQIVEQFNPLTSHPTPLQISALRSLLLSNSVTFKRMAQRILDDPEPRSVLGLGALWGALDRPALRYVSRSPEILDLIKQLIPDDTLRATALSGKQSLQAGFQAAKDWGYDKIFVLVDNVKTQQSAAAAVETINPLFDFIEKWEQQDVYWKFFLPPELHSEVSSRLKNWVLRFSPFETKIEWNEHSLRRLLVERFRAAASRRLGLDDMVEARLVGRIDNLILDAAKGSPRRLLQIIDSLITAHISNALRTHENLITLADWERMRDEWTPDDTPPAAVI